MFEDVQQDPYPTYHWKNAKSFAVLSIFSFSMQRLITNFTNKKEQKIQDLSKFSFSIVSEGSLTQCTRGSYRKFNIKRPRQQRSMLGTTAEYQMYPHCVSVLKHFLQDSEHHTLYKVGEFPLQIWSTMTDLAREVDRMVSLEMEAPCFHLDSRLQYFSVLFFIRVLSKGGISDFSPKLHCEEGKALARNNEQSPGLAIQQQE